MSTFREWATAIIAIIVLIGGMILLYFKIDGEVKTMMGAVIGYFFGQYVPSPKEKEKE